MNRAVQVTLLILTLNYYSVGQFEKEGFENWEMIGSYEKPTGWETNQDTVLLRIQKDTNSIEGKYSLKMLPSSNSSWHDCKSRLNRESRLSGQVGSNRCLVFYVKSIKDSTNKTGLTFIRITGRMYERLNINGHYYNWESFTEIPSYRRVEIPFTNKNIDSVSIRIEGGARSNGFDGCTARSESWIDGICIDYCNSTHVKNEENLINIEVSPNPSKGNLIVSVEPSRQMKYELINMQGRIVYMGKLTDEMISFDKKGVYHLNIRDATGKRLYGERIIFVK